MPLLCCVWLYTHKTLVEFGAFISVKSVQSISKQLHDLEKHRNGPFLMPDGKSQISSSIL